MQKKLLFLIAIISLPVCAAWQSIESTNFLVHFPESQHDLACQVTEKAEEIHQLLIPIYRTGSREKTEIVLNTETDLFNGSATPFPRNRIVLDLATIPAPGGITDSITYLLIHEYTHILQLDLNHGRATMVRDLFGKAPTYLTLPGAFAPLWFVEGYAVYQESKHTTGGRAESAEYRALMYAEIEADRFLTPDKLEGFFERDTWPSLQNYAYIYGAQFVSYLVETYGEERLAKLIWELGEIHVDFNLSFSKVYGNSLDNIWQDWKRSITFSQTQKPVLLTNLGGQTTWPQVSSDGSLYYVTSQGRYVPSLRMRTLKGGERQLLFGHLDSPAVPSSDGRYLVYAKPEYFDPDSIYTDLYLYDLATKKEQRLTWGLRATEPAWSNDGNIYFIRRQDPVTSLELLEANGNCKVILPAKEGVRYSSPVLSPDGERLALIIWREGGFQDLALLDLKEGKLRYLTEDRYLESTPAWWGNWLLYTSDFGSLEQIYATDCKDKHFKVTTLPTGGRQPAPFGNDLIYVALSGKGYDLAIMPLDQNTWYPVVRRREHYNFTPRSAKNYSATAYNPLRSAKATWWWPKADLSWDVLTEGLVMENFRGFDTGGSDALGTFSWSFSGLWDFYPSFAAGADFSVYKKLGFLETQVQTQVLTAGGIGYGLAAQYPLVARLNRNLYLAGQAVKLPESGEAIMGLAWTSVSGQNRRYDIFQGSGSVGYLKRESEESPLATGTLAWQGRWLDGIRLGVTFQGFTCRIPDSINLAMKGFEEDRGAKQARVRALLERNLITIHRGHYLPVDSLKGRIFAEYGAAWNREPLWRQSLGGELGLRTGLGEFVVGLAFPKGRERLFYFELRGF